MSADAGGRLWQTFRRNVGPYGVVERIESSLKGGVPDVTYAIGGAAGWVELKFLPCWPARETTPVVVRSLKVSQVEFISRWCGRGYGRAFTLLQVDHDNTPEYLLLGASATMALYRRQLTARELRSCALPHALSRGVFPTQSVLRALTGRDVPVIPGDGQVNDG